MTAAYDTLKIARQLAQAGLDPKTAEGVSETFAQVLTDREGGLATKADLQELRAATKADLQELRSEMQELRADGRASEATLRGEIKMASADTLRWMIGSQIAISGILFAAIKLL